MNNKITQIILTFDHGGEGWINYSLAVPVIASHIRYITFRASISVSVLGQGFSITVYGFGYCRERCTLLMM